MGGPTPRHCKNPAKTHVFTDSRSEMKKVNMALAAYTLRLFKFNCFNKNGLFDRDRAIFPRSSKYSSPYFDRFARET